MGASKKSLTPAAQVVPYEPTDAECLSLQRLQDRRTQRGALARVTVTKTADHAVSVAIDHKDPETGWLVMTAALGVTSPRVTEVILDQVCELAETSDGISEKDVNRLFAIVQDIQPRDTVEALLATQMAAIHMATMKQANLLKKSTNIPQQDSNNNALNKLARTFAAQADTLKKYRSKGEQKVIVEHQHVHVHPGGQAVVGAVNHGMGGEGNSKKDDQPHERDEPLRLPERATMLSQVEADGVQVPGAGDDGLECVQVSRGAGRPNLRAVE